MLVMTHIVQVRACGLVKRTMPACVWSADCDRRFGAEVPVLTELFFDKFDVTVSALGLGQRTIAWSESLRDKLNVRV